jgi:hypothetical protein
MIPIVVLDGEVPRLSEAELVLVVSEVNGFYTDTVEAWELLLDGVVRPEFNMLDFDAITDRFQYHPDWREYTREVLCRVYGSVLIEHRANMFREIGDVDRYAANVSGTHIRYSGYACA